MKGLEPTTFMTAPSGGWRLKYHSEYRSRPVFEGQAPRRMVRQRTREGVSNVATRDLTEGTIGERAERAGVRLTGRRFETKWAPLTTEFWAMIAVIAVTLIAAAVADNFDAPRAWLIVGIVATGYIVSRGLAKAGNSHHGDDGSRGY
jgi:hypothetical protein